MIPDKVKALFEFVDFLDKNKKEYIEKYIPLVNELMELDKKRNELNPRLNYKDKKQYDLIQKEIEDKLAPIEKNVTQPILNKLRELEIWDGDNHFISIYNNNTGAVHELTNGFIASDIKEIQKYKDMYLNFRAETNTSFLSLGFMFDNLDEVLKIPFDYFKDINSNGFELFKKKARETFELKKPDYELQKRFDELNNKFRVQHIITKEDLKYFPNAKKGDIITKNPPIPDSTTREACIIR